MSILFIKVLHFSSQDDGIKIFKISFKDFIAKNNYSGEHIGTTEKSCKESHLGFDSIKR